MEDDTAAWRRQRSDALAARAAALDRKREAETAQARKLLAEFVDELVRLGIPPSRLRARVPERRVTYRTGISGWYLRRNRSLGVDVHGAFYVLDTPWSLRSRLFGADVSPSDPPLTVGAGARDGESMPLARLLQLRLEEIRDEQRNT
ncbi:hypothetical protein EF847_02090 [Actinobacteria bacterium YIM 96077]|uniref:Uncharacterized protein n=1 Tax=Phytoactinopolyspora halophila TaxID=1981511 RepID=A0A329QZW7_9ACTN|nr:hypothetical protein [Phytoactinopolyspora halophila]AYY11696.1 hypothetical protein EF847_02090 [Actinobacteria bacterium YIM 96077]RAW17871.1 hypothetical protein DPM12_03190 [Phytoactinopolyspora halophila]